MKLRSLALVIFMMLGAGIFYGLNSAHFKKIEIARGPVEKIDKTSLRVHREALENIKTTRISFMEFPDRLYLTGKIGITEDRTTVIPSRVIGRIENIYFASGEMVAKGQLLATLFSPDFVAAKEEYVQALKQSRRPSGGAKTDIDDFADLARLARKKLETLGLTKQDIDAIANSAAEGASNGAANGSGSGSDNEADSETDPNSKNSPLLNLRAPRSGYIIAKGAVLGNTVNVGDTLFTIGDMDKVWFTGDLYPEDLSKVHKGQEVYVAVAGMNLTKPLKGQVSFISPMVDPVSRTIKIRALVENPNGELKADQYVQGSVTLNDRKALLVPTTAVVRTSDGPVIFEKSSPANLQEQSESVEFKKVAVVLGNERDGMVAVEKGLENGDEVVSDGAWLLQGALESAENQK